MLFVVVTGEPFDVSTVPSLYVVTIVGVVTVGVEGEVSVEDIGTSIVGAKGAVSEVGDCKTEPASSVVIEMLSISGKLSEIKENTGVKEIIFFPSFVLTITPFGGKGVFLLLPIFLPALEGALVASCCEEFLGVAINY